MFGLSEEDINEIKEIIAQFSDVKEMLIIGSRAKGNYKKTSDVDIVLKGKNITHSTIVGISGKLNDETLMPYHFDVINYNTISNKALIKHIEQCGLPF